MNLYMIFLNDNDDEDLNGGPPKKHVNCSFSICECWN